MNRERIVIIGASLTGATAAATLREEGFDGAIDLIGAETQPPYNRPPLSKEYLRGQARFEDQLVKPADYYAEQNITLRLGVRASAVDSKRKVVELDGGEQIAYDRLLVATGGRNRSLSGPGTGMEGLFQLRTVEDCDRIRSAARAGARVVVVGLGFIGSEVAASLRQLGLEVAAVEGHPVPLARVLGEEVGKVLADIHRENGVDLALGDSVAAFEGGQRVEGVRTKNGRHLECDLVVAGIGIMPNSELLAASGAAVDNGVLVDERCRTSLPDVYAAGDVANHLHPVFGRLRVEHWNNGFQQGRAAARSMLGRDQPYDYLHSFWSNQYDHVIEYVGFAARWDRLVFRGRPASRKFLGFYLNDGVVRAAVGLNRGGDPEDPKEDGELKAVASLIRNRVPVDPARLANEDVDLRGLASPEPNEAEEGPEAGTGSPPAGPMCSRTQRTLRHVPVLPGPCHACPIRASSPARWRAVRAGREVLHPDLLVGSRLDRRRRLTFRPPQQNAGWLLCQAALRQVCDAAPRATGRWSGVAVVPDSDSAHPDARRVDGRPDPDGEQQTQKEDRVGPHRRRRQRHQVGRDHSAYEPAQCDTGDQERSTLEAAFKVERSWPPVSH